MTTFSWTHTNLNVFDLDKSLEFYKEALGLTVTKTINADDGSFKIVYLGNLELTWLKDRAEPYNLGDNEIHIAYTTPDFEEAFKKHKEMKCNIYENRDMGIYFIQDPDGYWVEIIPER
jgi:lactoylglutathione lyase